MGPSPLTIVVVRPSIQPLPKNATFFFCSYDNNFVPLAGAGGAIITRHGFRPLRRAARLSGHRAAVRAGRMAAARAGLGRARGISGGGVAPGGGARLCRHLCARPIRRQRPDAARRDDHLRGVGDRLRLDRRLSVDPQHGGVDDRPLRRRGAARPLSAGADVDGAFRQLLPDRAGQRLRRGGIADPRPARRRRLRAERRQGVHLGRRPQRYLRRDGAHRRARPERHLVPGGRERHAGSVLRQEGEESSAGTRSRPRW